MIADRVQSVISKAQSSHEKDLSDQTSGAIDKASAPPPAEKKSDSGGMQNLLIGGSIAFAAIGSA